MSLPILRLALPSPLRRLFDYRAPADCDPALLVPGVRLRVPFGRRELVGVLVECAAHSEVAEERLRSAGALLDRQPVLPPALLELCRWTAGYYQHSLGDTFSWALPNLLRQGEAAERGEEHIWQVAAGAQLDDPRLKRAPRQRQALATLAQHPHGINQNLLEQFQLARDSLKLLHDKGLVEVLRRRPSEPEHHGGWLLQPELPLNAEQRSAFEAVRAGFGRFHPCLLAGVTGSGKTEVYLQLIRETLEAGRQALVLIPEINLGPQTLERFARRSRCLVLSDAAKTNRARMLRSPALSARFRRDAALNPTLRCDIFRPADCLAEAAWPSPSALAADPRRLSDLVVRDHVAADAGGDGDPVFPTFP